MERRGPVRNPPTWAHEKSREVSRESVLFARWVTHDENRLHNVDGAVTGHEQVVYGPHGGVNALEQEVADSPAQQAQPHPQGHLCVAGPIACQEEDVCVKG